MEPLLTVPQWLEKVGALPQGAARQGSERVLVDVRTYTVKPGTTPAQVELYEKFGFPIQLKHMGQPLCYLQGESGELNTLLHMWVYQSAADREQKRAGMQKDPD